MWGAGMGDTCAFLWAPGQGPWSVTGSMEGGDTEGTRQQGWVHGVGHRAVQARGRGQEAGEMHTARTSGLGGGSNVGNTTCNKGCMHQGDSTAGSIMEGSMGGQEGQHGGSIGG